MVKLYKVLGCLCLSIVMISIHSQVFAAEISHKEFLSSDFSKYFKNKKYVDALKASDELLKKYPQDALILRYRALTLEKLNHPHEAIKLYQAILMAHPNDIPARLFVGLAYIRESQYQKAEEELRFVIKYGATVEYRHWAQEQLTRLRLNEHLAGKLIEKKPYLLGKLGIDYDSNPLLIPNNKNLSLLGSKVASALYVSELNVGYPLLLKKDFRLDVIYIGEEYLHSAGAAQQVDFSSQGFALVARKRTFLGERPFLLESRYDFRANFLTSDFFSIVNRVFLSADTSYWSKTLTHFFTHFTVFNYGSDFVGVNPDQSSRSGVQEGIGITQYFYTPNQKSFFFIKGEGDFDQTRGSDFNRQGGQVLLGFDTPLFCPKIDLDVSTGFDWQTYPDFSSLSALDTRDRRDTGLDVYAGATYHWKKNLATRVFYRFIDSENSNGFFARTRHLAGVEVIFSF